MIKKIMLIVFAIFTLMIFTGCVGSSNSSTGSTGEENSTTQETENKTTIVKHYKGETEVKVNPQKIAILDFAVLDTIDLLGINTEIAAPITNIPVYLSKYKDLATPIGTLREPDLEMIFEFGPDIIFMTGRQDAYYEELSKIAQTLYFQLNSETYFEDVANNAISIGKIFEKENEVNEILEKVNNEVEEIKKIAESKNEKALVILTNDSTISAYGSGSRFGFIHDVLNVKKSDENIEVSTHGQEISYEYISEVNPDILFVVDRTKVNGGSNYAETTLDNELIKSTNAYKNNKIIYLNPEIWYISTGGLNSFPIMLQEVKDAL